jgi:DNA repair protein RadC
MATKKDNIKLYSLRKLQTKFPKEQITNSKMAEMFIRQFYGNDLEIFESSFILLLNQSNYTIGYAKISQGGITGTVVDMRIIAKYAVEALATSIIVAHNHPSGNKTPSQQDLQFTTKLKQGLALLDIRLNDHIILTADDYTSLADNGHL